MDMQPHPPLLLLLREKIGIWGIVAHPTVVGCKRKRKTWLPRSASASRTTHGKARPWIFQNSHTIWGFISRRNSYWAFFLPYSI